MELSYWILPMMLTFTIVNGQHNVVVLRAIKGEDARLPCGQGKVFLDGPESFVLWIKNDRDILYRYPTEGSNVFENLSYNMACTISDCLDDNTSLFLKQVTEKDAGVYSCRVHYQASPSVDNIIDLKLVESPGTPKIMTGNGEVITKGVIGPFGLGSNIILTCEIENERPETLLFWRRNGVARKNDHVTARNGIKSAVINIVNMTRDEQGARYECVAQNSDVSRPLVSGLVVKMYLPPLLVEIRLNDNLNFEAGQPRVVDCVVVGCTPPPLITWHLGNNMLRSNVHKELHDGNFTVSSLTLAPSFHDSNRQLVCRAYNSLMPEEIFQDNVTLNVGYRPVCASSRDMLIGIVDDQPETVTCTVEASPAPAQFIWIFSNSRTLYTSVTKLVGHTNRYSTSLIWSPQSDEIGELLCRATNIIGEQKQPCVYTITKGGPPVTPDCTMSRSQFDTIRVQCKKTWDGGRPQTIHLELLNGGGKLLQNVSDSAGNFRVPNIREQYNITAVVYATNERGRSETMVAQLLTKKPFQQQVFEPKERHWSTWLELAVALLSVCVVFILIIKCAIDFQSERHNRNNNIDVNLPNDVIVLSDTAHIEVNMKTEISVSDTNAMNLQNHDDVWTNLYLWRLLTGLYLFVSGVFHREPDITREERIIGTTNITVNQVAPCQNDYTSSPTPGSRQVIRCSEVTALERICPTGHHAYYV